MNDWTTQRPLTCLRQFTTNCNSSFRSVQEGKVLIALNWIQENNVNNAIIATDSWSAPLSIKHVKSYRLDSINEIHQVIFCLHEKGLNVVPAHAGFEGDEAIDKLVKL